MERILRFQHLAMATQFEIRCSHRDEEYARQAARFAFDVVDRLEQQLSRFVENSDISRINHLEPGEETRVAYETMQCLQLARLAWEQTGGAFDPSIGTGFDRLEIVPEQFTVRRPVQHGVDEQNQTGGLPRRSAPSTSDSGGGARRRDSGLPDFRTFGRPDYKIHLDLGAIGKGYAVDRVADALAEWDVANVLIDAGYSSVLALEPPEGRDAWPLTLTAPMQAGGEVFAHIDARQQALGASGIQKGDHIRDPRDGSPVRSRLGAWASAPRTVLADMCANIGVEASAAALADALSTAFMIMAPEDIDRYCQAHRGVEAWIVEGGIRHFGSAG